MRVWIAVWTGSSAITRVICDWIRGGAALRILVLVLAAGVIKGLPWTTRIAVILGCAWLLTAVCVGLRLPDPTSPEKKPAAPETSGDETEETDAQASGKSEQDAPEGPRPLARDTVIEALHGLLADTGGVHLQSLAKALPEGRWTTGDARSLLASHHIRVRPGVRVPGVGGREGVHRDDIPPLPSPDESPAPVADVVPGQSNNNNGDNTEGETFDSVPDEANPARTHVLWRRKKAPAA